jgi:hypothetical protein
VYCGSRLDSSPKSAQPAPRTLLLRCARLPASFAPLSLTIDEQVQPPGPGAKRLASAWCIDAENADR